MGETEVIDFLDVGIECEHPPVPPRDGLGAKGKTVAIHGESQQAHALPCPIHHVEKRTCHREGHHDG